MNQFAQSNMIKQQLRTSNVLDEKIIDLFYHLPRADFVPKQYVPFAYSDAQIPLGHNQHMMTPAEEGLILQALQLRGDETILEVGTGSAYLTTLLSHLCKKVITLDLFPEFIESAKKKLAAHHCENVECYTHNGIKGWAERAPYDCIILSGGLLKVPDELFLELAPHGRLIAFIGKPPVLSAMLYQVTAHQTITKTFLFNTSLPPLISLQSKCKFVF